MSMLINMAMLLTKLLITFQISLLIFLLLIYYNNDTMSFNENYIIILDTCYNFLFTFILIQIKSNLFAKVLLHQVVMRMTLEELIALQPIKDLSLHVIA